MWKHDCFGKVSFILDMFKSKLNSCIFHFREIFSKRIYNCVQSNMGLEQKAYSTSYYAQNDFINLKTKGITIGNLQIFPIIIKTFTNCISTKQTHFISGSFASWFGYSNIEFHHFCNNGADIIVPIIQVLFFIYNIFEYHCSFKANKLLFPLFNCSKYYLEFDNFYTSQTNIFLVWYNLNFIYLFEYSKNKSESCDLIIVTRWLEQKILVLVRDDPFLDCNWFICSE